MEDTVRDAETGEVGEGEGVESVPEVAGDRESPHPDPLPEGEGDSPDPEAEIERLRGEVGETRTRWMESHRRALLAENAGGVVPELVAGSTVEELERSVEVARGAFEAARAAALAEVASTQIPAGNPVRRGPDVEAMSPLEKIAHGLRRE